MVWKSQRVTCVSPILTVIAVLASVQSVGATSAIDYDCTESAGKSVCADEAQYLPGTIAFLSGDGYAAGASVTIKVTRPDGSVVTGDGSGLPWPTAYDTVTANEEGMFVFYYTVNGTEGAYQVEVLEGTAVAVTSSIGCIDGAKGFVDDDAVATTTSSAKVTVDWRGASGDPTQVRFANDATPSDGCADLGGGTYSAWQPVNDVDGSNTETYSWMLASGANGERRVCVESAKGTLNSPVDLKSDLDSIILSVANPPLGDSCGLDIVLVIDTSGSISNAELAQTKTAFIGFVDAFLPATPSEIAVVEFSTLAFVRLGFSSDKTLITNTINSLTNEGATNWDDALYDARNLFPNRLDKQDLIIFSSDGNPNRIFGHLGQPDQAATSSVALAYAVEEADLAKAAGIRIETIGIGNDLNIANLEAISSADAVTTSDFDTLADDLAALAASICDSTITVTKLLDIDGNLATTGDQVPEPGWTFTANVDAPDFATPPSGATDASGQIVFDIDLGDDLSAVADITEVVPSGYSLLSAGCTLDGSPIGVPSGNGVHNMTVGVLDFITCTIINHRFCGNGVLDAGEQCDDGNVLDGDCCSSTCQYETSGSACGNQTPEGACDLADVCDGAGTCISNRTPAGTTCRPVAGACDVAESCDGVSADCPADSYQTSAVQCRASAGDCDPPEFCTGTGPDCPADVLNPSTTECRASAGVCDPAEFCTGTDPSCPTDELQPATLECRASTGDCDPAEFCTGADPGCPADVLSPSTTECRASAGDCDPAEFCTGTDPDCPADVLSPGTTECRASAGDCDPAEFCTGTDPGCPADVLAPSTTECRASAGVCDPAEFCTGTDPSCPTDALQPATLECRASTGDCDPPEFCTSTDPDCPSDLLAPDTIECRPTAGDCDPPEFCTGTDPDCPVDVLSPGTTECRASAGDCDPPEFCTGTDPTCPTDALSPGSTECRSSAGDCDPPEFCTGTDPDCPTDLLDPATVECRPSAGDCDPAEFCTGTGPACPTDVLDPDTVECRPSAGDCDPAEFCTGADPNCPTDVLDPDTVECRASAGDCDPPEFCTGAGPSCPADLLDPDTVECRPSAGDCDPPEFCIGTDPDCPTDVLDPDTTECRPSGGVCDPAELCTGIDPDCPTDVLDSTTVCRPANGDCDVAEVCDGTGVDCPADGYATGTVCRPSTGVCDPEELCDGTGPDCPSDLLDSVTVCRPAVDDCDTAEVCDGSNADCPADGVAGPGAPCSDDGNECTRDECNGTDVFCTHSDNQLCGACCLPDSTCRDDLLGGSCESLGGTFIGSTEPCNGDTDGDGVVDVCDQCPGVSDADFAPECKTAIPTMSEWGLVILALMLLVIGKIHFGRNRLRTI